MAKVNSDANTGQAEMAEAQTQEPDLLSDITEINAYAIAGSAFRGIIPGMQQARLWAHVVATQAVYPTAVDIFLLG